MYHKFKHFTIFGIFNFLLLCSVYFYINLNMGIHLPYCYPKTIRKNSSKTEIEFIHNAQLSSCYRTLKRGKILVVATVFVRRGDFKTRKTIRSTWASVKTYKNFIFETIFLLGSSKENDGLDDAIFEESLRFKDIILGNFIDSYRNLTYKRLMGSKWTLHHCPNAKFVLKVDDEWFVDTFRALQLINETIPRIKSQNIGHFGCLIYQRNIPPRNLSHKLGISNAEFAREFFPDFCLGPASISTREALLKEYSVKDQIPFFWNEDVFHTGLLREYYELVNNEEIKLDNLEPSMFLAFSSADYDELKPERLRAWCKGNESNYMLGPIYDHTFDAIYLEVDHSNFTPDFKCIWRKTKEVKKYREIHHKEIMLLKRQREKENEEFLEEDQVDYDDD